MVQMTVTENKDENYTTALRLIRSACDKYQCRMVMLPECFNTMHGKKDMFVKNAEIIPTGTTCMLLANIAKELNIYVVAGSIPERDETIKDRFYNTMVVFSPTGTLVAKHRQVHVMDMDVTNEFKMCETNFITGGKTLTMFDMDGIKVGMGVCCDTFFCEMATLYRKNGMSSIFKLVIRLCPVFRKLIFIYRL